MRDRIFLARGSFSVGARSIKITEDVRKHAAELGLSKFDATEAGMKEKATEFVKKGSEVCTSN
jgi:hypothetical protein